MPEEKKLGTKELTEAVGAVVGIANGVGDALKDGKIGLEDLATLLVILPKVAVAVDGAASIPDEVMDLDAAEGAALVASVAADLKVGDEKAKAIVAASLEMLLAARKVVVAATA